MWVDEDEPEGAREAIRQDLLHAVKNNFSLRSVKARLLEYRLYREESDLFDSVEEKQRLAFYTNRNELLDQWDSNPDLVERKVWPDALGLAERAGPDALFRGLRSVLESDYVSLPGGRKRKRPQYYNPRLKAGIDKIRMVCLLTVFGKLLQLFCTLSKTKNSKDTVYT